MCIGGGASTADRDQDFHVVLAGQEPLEPVLNMETKDVLPCCCEAGYLLCRHRLRALRASLRDLRIFKLPDALRLPAPAPAPFPPAS